MPLPGGAGFALSAIQKVSKSLKSAKADEILEALEKTLASEYECVVFGHPNYKTDWTLGYWFLIAFWSARTGQVSLFATEENTLRAVVGGYDCIGIGRELAHYLLARPSDSSMPGEKKASLEMSYMLEHVKTHVPNCGGRSQVLVLRNDGSFEFLSPARLDISARLSVNYDLWARKLLYAAADETLRDEDYDHLIEEFTENARTLRMLWKSV